MSRCQTERGQANVKDSIRTLTQKSRPLAVPNVKNSTIKAKVLF